VNDSTKLLWAAVSFNSSLGSSRASRQDSASRRGRALKEAHRLLSQVKLQDLFAHTAHRNQKCRGCISDAMNSDCELLRCEISDERCALRIDCKNPAASAIGSGRDNNTCFGDRRFRVIDIAHQDFQGSSRVVGKLRYDQRDSWLLRRRRRKRSLPARRLKLREVLSLRETSTASSLIDTSLPNASELSCGAECESLNQTAWGRRQLQLLVRPRYHIGRVARNVSDACHVTRKIAEADASAIARATRQLGCPILRRSLALTTRMAAATASE
jgi:hypothetical protein